MAIQFTLIFCLLSLLQDSGFKKENYFMGQIEYSYTYESNTLNIDSLSKIKPAKSIFRYDLHNYQSKFIGRETHTYFYSGILNKCASATNNRQNYDCEDYGTLTDSILSYKVYDTSEKVFGHNCKIVEYQTKYFWNKYYVSTDLKIAPGTYQRHLAYNWSFYGEKAEGGLILKLEHRFKKYTMRGVVNDLKKHEDNFKALEIDENTLAKICGKKN